ncbi:MAG: cytidine deaminase [Oscillospiraceae bacterium]|nr:cytidine deaminase [Oscillospiraceae bacterium]
MTDQELAALAVSSMERAYCPYSRFPVGAALECASGAVYTGCNVESAAYGSTICAERTALVKAVSEGERSFVRLAVAGQSEDCCWPCGACRQMLYEFAPQLRVLAVRRDGSYEEAALDGLLPHGFGAAHLGK